MAELLHSQVSPRSATNSIAVNTKLNLVRLFGAEASMTDGSYEYPRVKLIDAITDTVAAKI